MERMSARVCIPDQQVISHQQPSLLTCSCALDLPSDLRYALGIYRLLLFPNSDKAF